MAARMAMIAITTKSSIKVKPVFGLGEQRESLFAFVPGTPEDPSSHPGLQAKSAIPWVIYPTAVLSGLPYFVAGI
jgi:hypothetical protein